MILGLHYTAMPHHTPINRDQKTKGKNQLYDIVMEFKEVLIIKLVTALLKSRNICQTYNRYLSFSYAT